MNLDVDFSQCLLHAAMWLLQSLTKLSLFLDEWFECLSHYIGRHDDDLSSHGYKPWIPVEREVNRARLMKISISKNKRRLLRAKATASQDRLSYEAVEIPMKRPRYQQKNA